VNQAPIINEETGETGPLPADYRYTAKYIDWDVLEPFVVAQCPDFKRLIYEKGAQIPVLKVPFFPMTALKDSTTIDVNRDPSLRPEVGALLPGNYTVGVAGAYPTFGGAAGAYAANNAGGAMTGDVTMTEISNITETASPAATQTLAGFTWLTTSDNPHYGDPTAGWLITLNYTGVGFDGQQEGPGVFDIGHLHTIRTSAYGGANTAFNYRLITNTHTTYTHDLLIDGNGGRDRYSLYININAVADHNVWNVIGWEADDRGLTSLMSTVLGENCAMYNCTGTVGAGDGYRLGNVASTWRNCTSYDNAGVDFLQHGVAIGRYCRSSDGTAADVNWGAGFGNTINAVVLNDVQGVNDAVANFFDIIVGGPLDSAGEVNAIAARVACIRNRVVPNAGGFTSVGPAEIPPVAPPPTPIPEEEAIIYGRSYIGIGMGIAIGL
jgi:hypothetical protein